MCVCCELLCPPVNARCVQFKLGLDVDEESDEEEGEATATEMDGPHVDNQQHVGDGAAPLAAQNGVS